MADNLTLDIDFFTDENNTSEFYWDVKISKDGDLEGSNSIDTAILMSLFTDKRADVSEIRESSQRRGWWGNLFNDNVGYEIGSKIWLNSSQGRITAENLNSLNTNSLESLAWLKEDNIVDDIKVSSEKTGNREIRLHIKFVIGANTIDRNFILWENSRWR